MAELPYVQGHNPAVYRSHESRAAADTCGYFLKHLKGDSKILDAGCGPGSVTSSLAVLLEATGGTVLGVDASETAIERARAQSNLPANCSFAVADILALPYPDASFDAVYTSQVLAHIPSAAAAVKELRRVCRPNGFVALREGDFYTTTMYPIIPELEKWKQASLEILERNNCNPRAAMQLVEWALEAGFDESRIELSMGGIVYSGSQRKFWGETMSGRVSSDETWRAHAQDAGVNPEDFEAMQVGWARFVADPSSVFTMPCGQAICWKD
jgi:ubiquinone/menaquinone biosynthesis C-methylase UbiE